MRPLFEAVAALHYGNPSAFFYDMFADKSSLRTILLGRAEDKQTQVIYLATHGDENQIGPNALSTISRAEFRNILAGANGSGQIRGLYLGTCLTGNISTAKFLLEHAHNRLEWVAGYRESVDWIDGSAIDIIFFHKLIQLYVKNTKKRRGKLGAREIAHAAASELNKLVPGAHSKYGFNIYFREGAEVRSMFV